MRNSIFDPANCVTEFRAHVAIFRFPECCYITRRSVYILSIIYYNKIVLCIWSLHRESYKNV